MRILATVTIAAMLTGFIASGAHAQFGPPIRDLDDAFSTLLEQLEVHRNAVTMQRAEWNNAAQAYCFQFTTPNPYSGRNQSQFYGVTPDGLVGPGALICAPRSPQRANPVPAPAVEPRPRVEDVPTTQMSDASFAVLLAHLRRCWSVDAGMMGARDTTISIEAELSGSRAVKTIRAPSGVPTDPRKRALFEAARRSLLNPSCSPLPRIDVKSNTLTLRFNGTGFIR
jgi:hypothetical protein